MEEGARLNLHRDPATHINHLKTAEKWLVAIGRALIHDVELLVLDEPTVALDSVDAANLFRILRDLRACGKTILYISHRLEEIFEIADRVTVMKDGMTVACRDIADVSEEELISLMLGGRPPKPLGQRSIQAIDSGDPLLSVRNLTRRGVIHGVNLDLFRGEILGIGGLVGSGRTELLEALFGSAPKSDGEISVEGRPLQLRSPGDALREKFAMLPEDRRGQALFLESPITQNISLANLSRIHCGKRVPLLSARKEMGLARKFIDELAIATTGPRQLVKFLSGGNQQKVVLARWLATDAGIFLLDEPTVGIDVGAKQEVYALMRKLAEQGAGVILVSSDFSELVLACDRVVVMREGTLVKELVGEEIDEENILKACYRTRSGDHSHEGE